MQLLNILAQVPIPQPDSTAVKGIKSVGDSIAALTPAKMATSIKDLDWSEVLTSLSSTMVSFTLRIIAAILIFYVGKLIINKLHRVLHNTMVKREWDLSLGSFLLSLFKFVMLFLLIITVVGVLGIETSSFIALFASAGVAIGMALSGTLQNFAGGVVILLLKPYKIGDFIEFGTFKGCVKEIQIFHTILTTYNNERVIIPNGGISTGTINNLSTERFRRVEWRVSISYGDSVELARKVALEIIADEKRIVNNEIAKRDLPVGSILLEKNYEPS
ncbi:MAG: mechanosensitive ion channel, partial [Muribaculaceae bacterium]|nr:mechanosensitive ion channel [Muribaculaceae bacterium]